MWNDIKKMFKEENKSSPKPFREPGPGAGHLGPALAL